MFHQCNIIYALIRALKKKEKHSFIVLTGLNLFI